MTEHCKDFLRWLVVTLILSSLYQINQYTKDVMPSIKPSDAQSSQYNITALASPVSTADVVHRSKVTKKQGGVGIMNLTLKSTDMIQNLSNKTSSLLQGESNYNGNMDDNVPVLNGTVSGMDVNVSGLKGSVSGILHWNRDTRQAVMKEYQVQMTHESEERFIKPLLVGGIHGRLVNGRLSVEINETYAFWHNGQSKLCQLLRNMTLVSSLDEIMPSATNHNETALPRPLLNLTIDCEYLATQDGFGQGNWVTALYVVRMAAAKARVDFQFQCTSGYDSRMKLLLPWFSGYYPSPKDDELWPFDSNHPSEGEVCTDRYPLIRIDKMANAIQADIRNMAVTILGTNAVSEMGHDRVMPKSTVEETFGLVPKVNLDDVAIHFRCGDIMGGVLRGDFGLIKFNEYPKWIWNETKSIGILTQPFSKDLNRKRDSGKTEDCQRATYLLVDFLQSQYPETSITIRNDANETLPLVYARLALAKQSFTSLSSFGIFPVIGTFGHGYFQRGNRGVNPFATHVPQYLPNLHEMLAPVASSYQIKKAGLNATLAWFVSNDPVLENHVNVSHFTVAYGPREEN